MTLHGMRHTRPTRSSSDAEGSCVRGTLHRGADRLHQGALRRLNAGDAGDPCEFEFGKPLQPRPPSLQPRLFQEPARCGSCRVAASLCGLELKYAAKRIASGFADTLRTNLEPRDLEAVVPRAPPTKVPKGLVFKPGRIFADTRFVSLRIADHWQYRCRSDPAPHCSSAVLAQPPSSRSPTSPTGKPS